MTTLIVQPAYGRDYKSVAAVIKDWNANKDFRIATFGPDHGRYINKQDAVGITINVRYQRDTKITVIKPVTA